MPPLHTKRWQEFFISDLFRLETGKCSQANQLKKSADGVPYIGATNRNNGVMDFVEPNEKFISRGNAIAFVCDGEGSMGYSFYKSEDCIATTNIIFGYADFLNEHVGMFITTVADKIRGKYSYNYKRRLLRLRKEKILLPVTDDGAPDFDFMEAYIVAHKTKILQRYRDYLYIPPHAGVSPLDEKTWCEFFITDIADIISGRDINLADQISGKIPYISSSSINNGIYNFVDNENETLESDCISVNRTGSVGYAFFHPYAALYSNNVRKLRLHIKNYCASFFIANQIASQRGKYNYGYILGTERLKRQKILLPVTDDGAPDFEYMENFTRLKFAETLRRYEKFFEERN